MTAWSRRSPLAPSSGREAAMRRARQHFTPTLASWLNAIEGLFAILASRRLERGVFITVADLQEAIDRFLDDHGARSKPFQWVADRQARAHAFRFDPRAANLFLRVEELSV
jgi:transposase